MYLPSCIRIRIAFSASVLPPIFRIAYGLGVGKAKALVTGWAFV